MKCKISIIIPCYNAERYLSNCYLSLKKQTFKDWEAIFIDDGSIDGTLNILKTYAELDSRVKFYSQENQGAAKARERGLDKAYGEFITFLDADDTLMPDALEILYHTAITENSDIVISGFNIIREGKIYKKISPTLHSTNSEIFLSGVLCGKYGWELCSKLYRKILFKDIENYSSLKIGEDAAVFIQLVLNSKKIASTKCPTYNYTYNIDSISKIRTREFAYECLKAPFIIQSIFEKYNKTSLYKNDIDSVFLLFYSTSIKRYRLNRSDITIKKIWSKHATLKSLLQIPLKKMLYILFNYYL